MQQLRCPNCGTPYNPGDAFCGECGQPLPAAPAPPYVAATSAEQPARAPQTAPQAAPQGYTAQQATTAPVAATTPERRGVNPLLIGGGVAALLVVLLGIFVLPGLLNPGPTPVPTTRPTASATPAVLATATSGPTRVETPTAEPDHQTPTAGIATLPPATPTAPIFALVTPQATITVSAGPAAARFRIEADPATLDPQRASNVVEVSLVKLVFEPLLVLDDQLGPAPGSADSWEVSEDGLVYTLQLRQGLVFSDGTPLTAADFEYAWKRLFDPRLQSAYARLAFVIAGSEDYAEGPEDDEEALRELRDEVGVRATADDIITFTLREPAPYFPYLLTLHIGSPVRQELVEGSEDWTQPATFIGNGAYVLAQRDRGSRLVFEANPSYHRGAPRLEQLEARVIPNERTALSAYRNGDLDWMLVDPANLDSVAVDPALEADLVRSEGSCTNFLVFNAYREPFKNAGVRRAFVQAADREDWAARRFHGVKPAYSLIPPGQPGHQADLNPLPYSPQAARDLLAAANASGLKSIDVEYVPPDAPDATAAAQSGKAVLDWLKVQLAEHLGITMNLKPMTQAQHDNLFRDANTVPLIYTYGWCQDYPDPQNWLSTLFHSQYGQVYTGWQSRTFDSTVLQADHEPDAQRRMELYVEAHALLVEEAPVLFYEWLENLWLVKPDYQDLRAHLNSQDTRIPSYSWLINLTE